MRVVFLGSGPTVGTDFACGPYAYPNDTSEAVLLQDAFSHAIDNANMYGIEYDSEAEGDYETVTNGDDLEYIWEIYDPEKHDHLLN